MIIHPYPSGYLEDVEDNLGCMLEYAAHSGHNPLAVWNIFISSRLAKQIERGNPRYLAGYSGVELLNLLVKDNGNNDNKTIMGDRYYWAGFALARLQYDTNLSFYEINKYMPLQEVLALYPALHEADITKFVDIAVAKIKGKKHGTNLRELRRACGYTQQQLAQRANVDLRSIQMYEQRRNDINKAQVDIVYALSKVLGCSIEDLLER